MQTCIFTRQKVQLVLQLIQIDQPVLFSFCELGPQTEYFLVERSYLRLLPLKHHAIGRLTAAPTVLRLVDTELIAADIVQVVRIVVVVIGVVCDDALLLLVLGGDPPEVLAVLAQVAHRLTVVLLEELQLLLVMGDSVAHRVDAVADLVQAADQVVQVQLGLVLVVLHEQLLLDLAEVKADLLQVELELLIRMLDLVHGLLQV